MPLTDEDDETEHDAVLASVQIRGVIERETNGWMSISKLRETRESPRPPDKDHDDINII